jgi:hypothetical protein
MRRVTLDTNCIYELEEIPSSPLHRLVEGARSGLILLQVSAAAGSERQRGGDHLPDFGEFHQRLAGGKLPVAKLLLPIGYYDVSYWDSCVYSDRSLEDLERQIHEILFPALAFDADDGVASDPEGAGRKWRNAKCDVQSMWCHIREGGGIFVTRDSNFLKQSKKSRLEALGVGLIATPEEAVRVLGL